MVQGFHIFGLRKIQWKRLFPLTIERKYSENQNIFFFGVQRYYSFLMDHSNNNIILRRFKK